MESSEFEAAVVEYDTVTRQLATATGLELEKLVIIQRDLEAFVNRRQNPLQSTVQAIGIVLPDGRAIEHASARAGSSSYESWSEVHHKNLVVKEGYKNIDDFIRAGGVRYTRTTYFIWLEMTSQPTAVKNALDLAYQLASARPQAVFVLDLWRSPEGVIKSYRFESLVELEKFLKHVKNPMSPKSPWWGWYDPRSKKYIYSKYGEETHSDIAERLYPDWRERESGPGNRSSPLVALRDGLVRFVIDEWPAGEDAYDAWGAPWAGGPNLVVDAYDVRRDADAIDAVLEAARKHARQFTGVTVSDGEGAALRADTIDEARKKLWEAKGNPMSPHSQWWGWYDPAKNKFIYPRAGETIHTDIALRLFPKEKDRDDAFEEASGRGMVRFALDLTVDGITPSASDKYGVPYLLVEARDIRRNADAIDRVLEAARGHSKLFNQIVVADGRGMIQNSKTIDEARQKLWEAKGNPVSRKSPWWGWYDPRKELFIYPKGKEHTHDDMAERMFPGYKDEDAAEKAGIAGMVRFGVEGATLLIDVSDLRAGRSVDAIDKVLEAARQHRSQFSKVVVQDWWSGINQESTSIDEARRKLWEAQNPKAPARSTWDVGQAQYEAYKAGVRAGDTGLFQDWIQKSGQSRRSPTLLARLQHEFYRGVMGEPWHTTQYKGAVIEQLAGGDYRVSLDPESRMESFREAVRFVDYWAKHQRNPRRDEYRTGRMLGLVMPGGKIIERPYSDFATHETMLMQTGYGSALDFFMAGGVRYIRRDNGMELELAADPRAAQNALKIAYETPREEYFVDLWRSPYHEPESRSFRSLVELEKFLKHVRKEAA